MSPRKKFFILIIILLVITVCSLGTGIYNFDDKKIELTTDKEINEKSSEYKWPEKINKVIGSLSPTIEKSEISYSFANYSGCFFSLKKSDNTFRALKIKVSKNAYNSGNDALVKIEYTAPDYNKNDTTDPLAKLKKQIVTLNCKPVSKETSASNDDDTADTATLTILDKGGTLKINPEKGLGLVMIDDDKEILLCQRTLSGKISYNKQL